MWYFMQPETYEAYKVLTRKVLNLSQRSILQHLHSSGLSSGKFEVHRCEKLDYV